eukprot:6286754-Prymnesium_polylepis.1
MARSPQGRRKRAEPCTQPACGPLRRPMARPPPADLSMPLHSNTTEVVYVYVYGGCLRYGVRRALGSVYVCVEASTKKCELKYATQ